ncbi:uncharacterized protein WM294_007359 [Sarcoramphus papa]
MQNLNGQNFAGKVTEAPAGLAKVFNQKVQIWFQEKQLACLCQYCEAAKLEKQSNKPTLWLDISLGADHGRSVCIIYVSVHWLNTDSQSGSLKHGKLKKKKKS